MHAFLLALLLAGCASTFDTPADAVPYCMTLGEVPTTVDGDVTCTGLDD